MSHRSSVASASLGSSRASTPASASRSTCASASDIRHSASSVLSRAGQTRVQLASTTERPQIANVGPGEGETVPEPVRRVFARYSSARPAGSPRMNGDAFARLCRDSDLLDERLAIHINLIFANVTRPEFVMEPAQLAKAFALVAKRKGTPVGDVHMAITNFCDLHPESAISFDRLGEWENLPASDTKDSLNHIEDVLTSGDTVLLKGSWLLQFSKTGGSLPRRRELPEGATWSPPLLLEKVKNDQLQRPSKGRAIKHSDSQSKPGTVIIAAVSCMWISMEHPDPNGQQLQAVCRRIQQCLDSKGIDSRPIDDVAIFWDYACLFQEEKTVVQKDEFQRLPQREKIIMQRAELQRSMSRRQLWHTHPMVEDWMLTEESPGVFICVKSCA